MKAKDTSPKEGFVVYALTPAISKSFFTPSFKYFESRTLPPPLPSIQAQNDLPWGIVWGFPRTTQ